jgi:hypothetical protein
LHKGKSWTCNFFEDVQISSLGNFPSFFSSKFQNNLAPKKQAGSSRIKGMPFLKVSKNV